MNNPNGQTVLEDARAYVARGWKVVPNPERTKEPVLPEWPDLDLSLDDLPAHFLVNGHRPNIGVILGKRSRGIVDVDNDAAEAIAFAKLWLPATGAVFGRPSKRRSHYLFYAADGVGPKTTQFKRPGNPQEKTGPAMLVELRGNGGQTIFPGSIHESGEAVEWERDGEPATIDGAELERAVRWIAAGSLLVPFWNEGRRNYLALALAGALLRAEWTVEDAGDFIEGLAQVAGDPDWSKRRRQCVESTASKLADGANAVGLPALAEQIGDEAVVKALVSWLRLGRSLQQPASATTPDTTAADASELPSIDAGIQSLKVVTTAAWDALQTANTPPRYFRQTGLLVRLHRDDAGGLDVQGLDDIKLRHEMARVARWWEWKKKGGEFAQVDAKPPLDVMRDMLATPEPPVPVLTRIVQAPIFAADSTLLVTPGYHPSARVYYDPPIGLTLPPISEHPTAQQRNQARRLIVDEMCGDFPFVGAAERAHAVALFLLPFVRELIAGGTPLHLIEAPTPGSGKGLLAELLLMPSLGSSPYVMAAATDDEEWRKRITAALLKAPGALQIDNVTRPLASGVLAAALTMPEWTDRPLGSTDIVRAPVRVVWLCTANNVVVSTEIARRCARIRLDPQVDRPWERQAAAFKKPRLAEWVAGHRGELVAAALTLVRAWIDQGKPMGTKTLGRFEQWSEVMGGILDTAGVPGFLTNLHEFYEASDAEGAVFHRFVTAWWESFKDQEVTASDLFPIAQEIDGLDLGRGAEHSQKTVFGKVLGRTRDRVIGNYRVAQGRVLHKTLTWRLLPTTSPSAAPTTTRPPGGGVGGFRGGSVPIPTRESKEDNTHNAHIQGGTEPPRNPPTPPPTRYLGNGAGGEKP